MRVSCGFPSKGIRAKSIGECWSPSCAEDGLSQIFIHPKESDSIAVAAILAHELDHAAVGLKCKHHGPFKVVALALGLEGDMKATVPGEPFKAMMVDMLDAIGPYPHASLHGANTSAGKKQTTRLLKVLCPSCGYTVRTTHQWIEHGYPMCPCGTEMVEPE
jgi:hypothetical protein